MAGTHGVLTLDDNEYAFVSVVGQELVFEHLNAFLAASDESLTAASALFIEKDTENVQEKYMLPGGGRLQERGGQAESATVKASGSWTVAYPIKRYGAQFAYTREAIAKMTLRKVQNDADTIVEQYRNTLRFEILKALFDNTQDTFIDDDKGSISIEPLANGDTVVYPPVSGSETEATEDHYLASGYVTGAISDTNNPYETITADLVHHFGGDTQGGNNIVTLIHPDEVSVTQDLTEFTDLPDNFIVSGDNTDVPTRLPVVPGSIIGRMRGQSSCWVSQWDWMPTGYMLAIHLEEKAPLKKRMPLAAWGLPSALELVQEHDTYPFRQAHYETYFGVGAGNRLNGVFLELTAGAFSIPSGYS